MSFFGFIKKTARLVKNTFNAAIGATVSSATAAVAVGVAAVAFPFAVIGAGIYVGHSFKRNLNASFIGSAIIGTLAAAASTAVFGLAIAAGVLASPFLGLARGWNNGFVAALIPSIFYHTVYDRYRERNRFIYAQRFYEIEQRARQRREEAQLQRGLHPVPPFDLDRRGLDANPPASPRQAANNQAAINRALANARLQNARAGLARYVNDPQISNDDLVEKLSKLNPTPNANLAFLKPEEIQEIQAIEDKEHPAHGLLARYQEIIAQQNGCSISASSIDEIKNPLTVEFKQGDSWHHYNYEADDYLLYVRSRPSNALADLPENRLKLDGKKLEFGEGNGSLQDEAGTIRVYKGLHPEVVDHLSKNAIPLAQELRIQLQNLGRHAAQSPRANVVYSPRFQQEGLRRAADGNVIIDIDINAQQQLEGLRCH